MAPPIYFFPKATLAQLVAPDTRTIKRELLRAVGLDDVLADVRTTDQASVFELASAGPGGSTGVLFTALQPGEPPARLGYKPEFQDWQAAGSALWIGLDREHPCEPSDLQRRKLIGGYRISLGCGELSIPILRSSRGETALPEDWGYDQAGNFTKSIKQEYRELWEASAEIYDVVIDRKPEATISHARGLELCLQIVGLNYRYGRQEQNRLHWIDSENWRDILSLAVDLPATKESAA